MARTRVRTLLLFAMGRGLVVILGVLGKNKGEINNDLHVGLDGTSGAFRGAGESGGGGMEGRF